MAVEFATGVSLHLEKRMNRIVEDNLRPGDDPGMPSYEQLHLPKMETASGLSPDDIAEGRGSKGIHGEGNVYRSFNFAQFLIYNNSRTLRALAIDGNDAERSLIADTLAGCGAEVSFAGDGVEAAQKMRQAHFDMVFAERHVVAKDKFRLISLARETSPDTEIFVVCKYEEMSNAVECTRRGAEGLIIKPDVKEQVAVAAGKTRERKDLRLLAYTDGLTSLFNRSTFEYFLLQECHRSTRHGHSFALMMLDIDDFKQYNDMNGHLVGDIALIKLGRLLRQCTRASDIPARYGGDEFAVILTEITRSEALHRATRLNRTVFLTPFQYEKNMGAKKLTASVGLALYPEHGKDHHEIVASADRALYRAKAEGKNRVCVFDKSDKPAGSGRW